MKKKNFASYILGMVCMVMASCQSNETRQLVKAADPQEPVVINSTTTTRLDKVDEGVQSGMGSGFGWLNDEGVFITEKPDPTADDPTSILREETKVGGISRSTATVTPDTTYVDDFNNDVVYELTNTTEADLTSPDSIGASVTKTYSANDGAVLPVVDLYKYVAANVTLAIPHYEPSSEITGVRYEDTADSDVRIVWTEITVTNKVVGTTQGTETTQVYEIGRYQKRDARDPYRVDIKDFELYRTYRYKDQHSICEGFLSFAVYNTRTGELVEEITTDQFSMQLGKTGHFGAPSKGSTIAEARLIGSAPTAVTESVVPDNKEAKDASHKAGNFTVSVSCTSQDYYVHFPVRGRDDSEGGMAAGGQNLFLEATLTYTRPATATEPAWTKTWKFTHKTEVNVKGWENRTPQVDRTGETINDVDGERKLRYAGTYVVEFINHLYLNGEEILYIPAEQKLEYDKNGEKKTEYGPYHLSSEVNGSDARPFHTSETAFDCWESYLP